jgi:hypothetical protein
MTVLSAKDADRLETVRPYGVEPGHAAVFNRPIEDLEQRTKDLDLMFLPARGFRVRQQIPATATVESEPGVWISGGLQINQVGLRTVAINPAGVGNIRIDLLWLNLTNGNLQCVESSELPVASGFAALTRPQLPSNSGAIPLAYVYVDADGTPFADTIALNTAGHIQDVRPGLGFVPAHELGTTAPLKDQGSGNLGTAWKLSRADHAHALNVDSNTPAEISPPGVGPKGPPASTYARRDHVHDLTMNEAPSNLKADVASGSPSVDGAKSLSRADHAHPANVGTTLGTQIVDPGVGGVPGTSAEYARQDHAHDLPVPNPYPTSTVIWNVVFGGGTIGSNNYLNVNGSSRTAAASTSGVQTKWYAPSDGTITAVYWRKTLANSFNFDVLLNGNPAESFTAAATSGSETGWSVTVTTGEFVEFQRSSGAGGDGMVLAMRYEAEV